MNLEFLADPNVWLTLVTLSALEIVLGIDNLVFISIAVGRLPEHQRAFARKFGIAVACITRIALLVSLAFLSRMQSDLFHIGGMGISVRDLILVLGGGFLLVKGAMEIRELITGGHDDDPRTTKSSQVFWVVIAQIAVIDIVFSLDSVITAVGIAEHIPVMVFAILLAVAIMLLAANPLGRFIDENPTIKMLALAFILLIGAVLILDGFDVHVPKPYIYFAMAFSVMVEVFNLLMRRRAGARLIPGGGEFLTVCRRPAPCAGHAAHPRRWLAAHEAGSPHDLPAPDRPHRPDPGPADRALVRGDVPAGLRQRLVAGAASDPAGQAARRGRQRLFGPAVLRDAWRGPGRAPGLCAVLRTGRGPA